MERPNQPNYLDTQPERLSRKQYKKKGEEDEESVAGLETQFQSAANKLKFEAFSSSASVYSRMNQDCQQGATPDNYFMNDSIITVKNMCPTDILKEDDGGAGKFMILFDEDEEIKVEEVDDVVISRKKP